MVEISKAEAALLGLLSECPMHAYQIEQEAEFRDMRSWTDLSMSSIYKLLKKLEEREMVIRKNEMSDEGRLRKMYSISKEGRAELKKKLKELLSEPEHTKWRVDVGTYNLDVLTKREALSCLKKYRKGLEEKIKCYKELDEFLKGLECPDYRSAVARRPVYLLEGEIKWLDSYMKELSKK